ncbi:hypothetical protein ABZ532_18925 [Streptomyces sp. NPDC019396]|uniref:hypothetical protein n=1 Tax=Streptomyces sp. NPDC019396 TaxID=3154687 RepID=UPI0033D29E96
MWPGQQPPGGEQNPQDPNQNPYAQPGYQQPNPYAQPGYQQPNPYAQPGQQPNPYPHQQPATPPYPHPAPPQPGPPQPGGPGGSSDRKKTTIVAIVAATAVVAAAVITGAVVLNGKDEGDDRADDGKKPVVSPAPSTQAPSPTANPRDGSNEAKPLITGWKVVTNPKHGTQFDVPPEWEVAGTGVATGFEDQEKGDGSPLIMMTAPAYFKSKWCSIDSNKDGRDEDSSLAGTGTKGGQGAKDTASASHSEAGTWVWAAYGQAEPQSKVKFTKPKPYTTKSGLSGHVSTAWIDGVKKDDKCDTDGKSIAFSFKNAKGDFANWILYANKGVPDELPDATIAQVLSTVRLAGASAS